jgi:hypothetical protein
MWYNKSLEQLGGVSLIHPFWNDEKRFELQFENWRTWSDRVRKNVDITLIDDHSKNPLIPGPKRTQILKDLGIKLSVYRIDQDIKWNTPGALNLGFTVAPKEWVLTMDSDCFFNNKNWEKLLDFKPSNNNLHKFNRYRIGTTESKNWLKTTKPLTCTIFMYKKVFQDLNGFDEDFTGEYSGGYGFFDNDFDRRAIDQGRKIKIVKDVVAGEWLPSVSGEPVFPTLVKGGNDHVKFHNINKNLMYKKKRGKVLQNNNILNFTWKKIYETN